MDSPLCPGAGLPPLRRLLAAALASLLVLWAPGAPPAWAWVDPSTGLPHASRVTRSADIPEKNWLPGHRGVDLGLPPGSEVRAAGNGVVAFAGVVAGSPTVSIDHADGIRTTYQPVYSRVREGDAVSEGEVIGILGRSSEHRGLHWGARTGPDTYINPLTLLAVPAIRLKPLG